MSLKDIPIRLSYKSKGEENLLDAFLIPALRQSVSYKRSVGFFSSTVFEIIGVGITQLIDNGGSIQIICSPELREEDIEAIHLGIKMKKAVAEHSILEDLEKCLDAVSDENLKMLIELIKNDQLNIMVVEVDDKLGIYHDKIGIIKDSDGNKVLFIGSPNESKNAYCGNYEKIRISVSWNENDIARIQDDEEEFDDIWNGTHEFISGVDCTSLVGRKLKQELYKRKSAVKEISKEGVNLRTYQKEAIKAWLDNNKHGFFVMATGTGKTWTAIYAALEVIKQENIFLAICAPYKHLVRQWYEDVHKVLPDNQIIMVSSENNDWENQLLDAIYNSKYLNGGTVIAISTIVSFNLEKFERVVSKTNMKRMLIVDEAHRFKNTSEQIPKKYAYMLGLSATPYSRKSDEVGKSLMNFFGGQVYNLPIEYAIEHTASRMDFHGRWERLCTSPDVIADIGHNAHGLKYNFAQIEHLLDAGKYSDVIIIYGIVADKDLDAVFPLMPKNANYIFTNASGKRALPASELLERYLSFMSASENGTERKTDAAPASSVRHLNARTAVNAESAETVSDAVAKAFALAGKFVASDPESKPLIYIGGSTFIVSEAISAIKNRK